jgi:hypothetical protein
MEYHISKRCDANINYEAWFLKWVSANYYFSNKVKRSFLITRSIPKLMFGISGMLKFLHPEFTTEYGVTIDNKKQLKEGWHLVNKFDNVNMKLAEVTKYLVKG